MNYEDFDNLLSGLSSMATIGALVIGAIWTYRRVVRTREANPKIDFLVDIEFVMHQSGVWAAEALAFVENKGLVRRDISSFTYDIRYFLKDGPLESNGDFSLFVPSEMEEGEGVLVAQDTLSLYLAIAPDSDSQCFPVAARTYLALNECEPLHLQNDTVIFYRTCLLLADDHLLKSTPGCQSGRECAGNDYHWHSVAGDHLNRSKRHAAQR